MSVLVSTSVSSSASSSTMTLPLTSPRPRMSIFASDGDRLARANKRQSVSKLYSMVQMEHDIEVEDDLSRSKIHPSHMKFSDILSPKVVARIKGEDFCAVEEEFCARKRRSISRFADSFVDSESDGFG